MSGLGELAGRTSCKAVERPQLGRQSEIVHVDVLRVEVLHPVHHVHNLLEYVHSLRSESLHSLFRFVDLDSTDLHQQHRDVNHLAVHDIESVHVLSKVVFVDFGLGEVSQGRLIRLLAKPVGEELFLVDLVGAQSRQLHFLDRIHRFELSVLGLSWRGVPFGMQSVKAPLVVVERRR